jgi:hypothetical protein
MRPPVPEFINEHTSPNAATNRMNPPVPEVTVLIHKITKDRRAGEDRLHIKKVLSYKHWDRRRQKPKR